MSAMGGERTFASVVTPETMGAAKIYGAVVFVITKGCYHALFPARGAHVPCRPPQRGRFSLCNMISMSRNRTLRILVSTVISIATLGVMIAIIM